MSNRDIKPWENHPEIWPTEARFWTYIRGVLRAGWKKHPVKLEYIKQRRQRIKNPIEKNRARFPECWGMICDICKKEIAQANIEIDHIGEGSQFRGLQDIEEYAAHLFLVDFNTLRAVCKPCHKVENHRQKKGVSFEEAAIEKEVIAILKEKPIDEVMQFLYDYGCIDVSNAKKRREALMIVLKNAGEFKESDNGSD